MKNGKQVYFHHSFTFDADTFQNLTDKQKQQLFQERDAAKRKSRSRKSETSDKATISQLRSELDTMSRTVATLISQAQSGASLGLPSQIHMPPDGQSQQQLPPPPPYHIMGDRNEQVNRRNAGGRTY